MRPALLEIEGFASFRERVCIAFDDADLFVLTGPTGAGKSSVIDAMTFALYGSVPRYDDRRLVAPVISQGMSAARVRLDFLLGKERYTAVRVVRRTGAGKASTKEARLEDARGAVLAGTADELTREVERLIGLSFDHFTKCVVLPQGAFAEFLHARPSQRQDMLIELLALDVYRRVGQAAGRRKAEAEQRSQLLGQRLEVELAGATAEALEEARSRVARLDTLREEVEAAAPRLDALRSAGAAAEGAADGAQERAAVLDRIRVPAGVADLASRIAAAADALGGATARVEKAVRAREEADQARSALPAEAELRATLDRHGRREAIVADLEKAEAAVAESSREAEESRAHAEEAERLRGQVHEAWERSRQEHLAYHLAQGLEVGGDCPVCLQEVVAMPRHTPPADLDEQRESRAGADQLVEAARRERERAGQKLARAETAAIGLREQLAKLSAELEGRAALAEVQADLERIAAAERVIRSARQAEQDARVAQRDAQAAADALSADREKAWRQFDTARDRGTAVAGERRSLGSTGGEESVATPTPPEVDRTDLAAAWKELAAWAAARAAAERDLAETQRAAAAKAVAEAREELAGLNAACLAAGVDSEGREPRDAVAAARAEAAAAAQGLAGRIAQAAEVRRDLADAKREGRVAGELHRLLGARNFEAWLLGRALERLIEGASRILRDLSNDGYSLSLDEASNTFYVIDHRNADERRPARTLSGGETFLASLALALSLSEHVADLAAGGTARLDALFLDEGFGTLDADTLETVAAAIEELGSRGRMVGLVTHVRDLAERIPVRYEVRKVASASTVSRVAG